MKHILYVEDNPSDIAAAREAVRQIDAPFQIHGVENGVQAFAFLDRRGEYRDAPRPDAILLDLNLPVISGQRVLEELRKQATWRPILVVMFTSSQRPEDRKAAERLGARFVSKPASWPDYIDLARLLQRCLENDALCAGESTG